MTATEFSNYKTIVPGLFDYSGANFKQVDSSSSGATFETGVPTMYASMSGKKFPLADMNGVGRLISQAQFFNQNGGYYTFSQAVSDMIGGYPLGAILRFKDTETGEIRVVRSMVADNDYNFVTNPEYIDGEHWMYVDNVKLTGVRPKIFPDWANVKSGTLSVGNVLTVHQNVVLFIQSGTATETTETDSAVYVYVDVRKDGDTEFHSAGMLAFIPPISSAFSLFGQSAALISEKIEKRNNYTSWYSSSPIQIYLNAGDSIQISTNTEFAYSSRYIYYPLKA